MSVMVQELDRARPSESQTQTRWWIVALLMALCFISHMNRVGMSTAGNTRIMGDYGITETKMGWVYTAFLITYSLFMLPGGLFIDRIGARRALGLMALSTAGLAALTGLGGVVATAHIWLWLIVVRSTMGIFTIPLHPGSARAVGTWIPPARQVQANGLITGAAVLGMACTPPLFGALIDAVTWPRAFFVTAACTAAVGIIWLVATRNLPSPAAGPTGPSSTLKWRDLLTSRSLLLLTLSYAALGYFQYVFFYWMDYYFQQVFGMSKIQARNFAALPMFAMAVTMPLGGWLSARLQARHGWRVGRVRVAAVAMFGAMVFLYLGVAINSQWWTVALLTLALGSMGVSEAAFWQTAIELGGSRGASAAAVMNTGGNGIGLLAPVVTPWVAHYFGWQTAVAGAAIVCLVGALCWLWIRPAPATNGELYESNRS